MMRAFFLAKKEIACYTEDNQSESGEINMTREYETIFAENFSFWEHLTEDQKDMLCRSATLATYPKGVNLHNGSEECAGLLYIKSGQLRAYLLSEDGREVTLYRLYPGDICILSASCVLDAITFDVSVDTVEKSEILSVSASAFHKLITENVYVEACSYHMAADRFSDVMWAMQQILFMAMDKRLAIFLTDEMAKTKSDEIHMTQEQIAKYMGTAREVVTRMIKYFAEEGIVETFRGGIRILDKKKLRSYL